MSEISVIYPEPKEEEKAEKAAVVSSEESSVDESTTENASPPEENKEESNPQKEDENKKAKKGKEKKKVVGLSKKEIDNLCKITCKKNISQVDEGCLVRCIDFYKMETFKLDRTDKTQREKFNQIIGFLTYVSQIPRKDWLCNKKAFKHDMLKKYAELKKDKNNKSIVKRMLAVHKEFGSIFTIEEIENIIFSYKRTNSITRVGIVASMVIICGAVYFTYPRSNAELMPYVSFNSVDEDVIVDDKYDPDGTLGEFVSVTDEDQSDAAVGSDKEKKKKKEITWLSVDFDSLHSVNKDIRAYMYFENTNTSYPVMWYTDNDKYLRADYRGNYSYAGSLFMDYRNHDDMSDPLTIIYGHNMKNGTMFGILKKYLDKDYLENNRYIQIATEEGVARYEIVSCKNISASSKLYSINTFGLKETLMNVFEYDYKPGERMVALSTCTGLGYENRFVVLAKKIEK